MRFNVLYITIFFIPWLNEKKISTLLTGFERSTGYSIRLFNYGDLSSRQLSEQRIVHKCWNYDLDNANIRKSGLFELNGSDASDSVIRILRYPKIWPIQIWSFGFGYPDNPDLRIKCKHYPLRIPISIGEEVVKRHLEETGIIRWAKPSFLPTIYLKFQEIYLNLIRNLAQIVKSRVSGSTSSTYWCKLESQIYQMYLIQRLKMSNVRWLWPWRYLHQTWFYLWKIITTEFVIVRTWSGAHFLRCQIL